MEEDLVAIDRWTQAHGMAINAKKTVYMVFSPRKRLSTASNLLFNIQLNGQSLTRVDDAKFLGLVLDEDLTFSKHVAHVKNKIRPMAFALKRINYLLTKSTAEQLYFAHVHSHLIYLNPIWSAALEKDTSFVFVLQKKALKFMNGLNMRTPSVQLFSQKILPLSRKII